MTNPERLTIAVNGEKPNEVKRKLVGILRDLSIDSHKYRIYVDEGSKTIIKLIIDELYVESLIYEGLNNQIQFISTSEKVRRILNLLSLDYEDLEDPRELKNFENETVDQVQEEITSFVNLDPATIKMSKILDSTNLTDVIEDSVQMIVQGEDIILRAKAVIVNRIEKEITDAMRSSNDNPRNAKKGIKILKKILFESFLQDNNFLGLSEKAGMNILELCKKNAVLNEELIEIIQNRNVNGFTRIKAATVYVDNLHKRSKMTDEHLKGIDFSDLKLFYQQNQNAFDIFEIKNLLYVFNRI
jgi:hypothetical protein